MNYVKVKLKVKVKASMCKFLFVGVFRNFYWLARCRNLDTFIGAVFRKQYCPCKLSFLPACFDCQILLCSQTALLMPFTMRTCSRLWYSGRLSFFINSSCHFSSLLRLSEIIKALIWIVHAWGNHWLPVTSAWHIGLWKRVFFLLKTSQTLFSSV